MECGFVFIAPGVFIAAGLAFIIEGWAFIMAGWAFIMVGWLFIGAGEGPATAAAVRLPMRVMVRSAFFMLLNTLGQGGPDEPLKRVGRCGRWSESYS